MIPTNLKPNLQRWLNVMKDHKLKPQVNLEYELEIRFKSFRVDPFTYGIPYRDFDRLRRHLNQEYQTLPLIEQRDEMVNLNKISKIRKTIREGHPDVWINKSRGAVGWDYDDQVYHLRYVFSRELTISPRTDFEPTSVRVKKRWSYYLMDKTFRVDLTEATMINNNNQTPSTYEAELEILDPNISLEQLSKIIGKIFKILHDTENIYNSTEYRQMVDFTNRSLKARSKDPYTINEWVLFRARNLHYNDMVMGGLIGNPTYSYSVTLKADGIRKMLVVSPTGIWLVMSLNQANLLYRFDRETLNQLRDRIGYILEGELIPENVPGGEEFRKPGGPTVKYWFLVYDCLATSNLNATNYPQIIGITGVQKKPHSERMVEAQRLTNVLMDQESGIFGDLISIQTKTILETKTFKGFSTGYHLFRIIRELELLRNTVYYKDDGFIFTPEEMSYDCEVNTEKDVKRRPRWTKIWNLPLHQRVLTKHPDICKWKPFQQLTIDFKIRLKTNFSGLSTIELLTGLPKGKGFKGETSIPFVGTGNFPFPVDQVELPEKGTLVYGLPTGTIVEYRWDNQRNLMIPVKIRWDKTKPNQNRFAQDTWKLIRNPIPISTLLGEDFNLMRKYHNRIKRNLFNSAFTTLKQKRGQQTPLTALDLGSGRGGDTIKLLGFSRIIFLEPNLEYLTELSSRIKGVYQQSGVEILSPIDNFQSKIQIASTRQDRAIILNTGAENSTLINQVVQSWLGGKADLVSIMLSMSFFWSSPKMWKALETTIVQNLSPTGQGIFFTIDGELVRQAFDPILMTNGRRIGGQSNSDSGQKVSLGKATLEYFADDSKLIIDIPGTEMVSQQTEYPPYLMDLEPGLKRNGFRITQLEQADQELLLNIGEYTLTKLYMGGKILSLDSIEPSIRKKKPRQNIIKRDPKSNRGCGPQGYIPQICVPRRKKIINRVSVQSPVKGAIPAQINTPVKVEESPLPMIPVWYDQANNIGIGDDKVEQISVSWYEKYPVVRIGTLSDGSCFFHAVLKAFYALYANNNKYTHRVDLVRKLRRDIAAVLNVKDPNSDEQKTYYQTAAKGAWVEFAEQQRLGANLESDFSLSAIQDLFNSSREVGNEVYQFVGDLLGIDIYVMMATEQNLHPILNTSLANRYQPAIVIAGNGSHYETIGINAGPKVGIQTVFLANDSFLIALRSQIEDQDGA